MFQAQPLVLHVHVVRIVPLSPQLHSVVLLAKSAGQTHQYQSSAKQASFVLLAHVMVLFARADTDVHQAHLQHKFVLHHFTVRIRASGIKPFVLLVTCVTRKECVQRLLALLAPSYLALAKNHVISALLVVTVLCQQKAYFALLDFIVQLELQHLYHVHLVTGVMLAQQRINCVQLENTALKPHPSLSIAQSDLSVIPLG